MDEGSLIERLPKKGEEDGTFDLDRDQLFGVDSKSFHMSES